MSSPVTLGPVAHFSLAVSDPPNSARWWTTNFNLEEWSSSDDKVVLGNDSVVFTMVRGRPGDEIGAVAPGSASMGLWFHDVDGYRWELFVQRESGD